MKPNTKTTRARSSSGRSRQEKHYPAYYLAAVLAGVLILEGLLLGAATPQAWQNGMQVLDISPAVGMVMSDGYTVVEPMLVQMDSITEFYHMAASEMMVLLDASGSDPLMLTRGVNEFYRLASLEMEKMFDFSDNFAYWPQVAGASISR